MCPHFFYTLNLLKIIAKSIEIRQIYKTYDRLVLERYEDGYKSVDSPDSKKEKDSSGAVVEEETDSVTRYCCPGIVIWGDMLILFFF